MGLSKKLQMRVLRTLRNYADEEVISVCQNKHIKYKGSFRGEQWTFTLPCSPSGNYVEGMLRSKIRNFDRRFNHSSNIYIANPVNS